jgi:hypothetical protein
VGATVSGSLQGSNGKICVIYTNSNPSGIRASSVDMGTGITHLIIGRVDWNTSTTLETVTMWVDPTDVTTEAAAAAAQFYSGTEFDLTSFNFVRPFTGNQAAGPPVAVAAVGSYDEIRVGGTWDSVTKTTIIPEPATFALVSLVGMTLVNRRRIAR